ncbi:MAG: YdcF family protein [Vagococcus sp.]
MGATLILFSIMIIVPLICFSYWVYFRPTSLWTGFFFLLLSGSLYGYLLLLISKVNVSVAIILFIPVAIVFLFIELFGLMTGVIALFWNERILLKKEGFSFSNLLPLIVAIGLLLFQVMVIILAYYSENPIITTLSSFINFSFMYMSGLFLLYFVTSVLYNHFPHVQKVDYIIILGAGLIDGEKVTPLLASRIEVGIKLYRKQVTRFNHQPIIILSGGQGSDEKISEAQAMMNYITEQEYELGTIYLEEKSTNTRENLQFSEAIAFQKDNIKSFNRKNIVLASNNYHILRAGKLAFKLGIPVRGVGAKTKMYYLPTAFIREYVGYLELTKKRHIIVFSSFLGLSVIGLVLQLAFK